MWPGEEARGKLTKKENRSILSTTYELLDVPHKSLLSIFTTASLYPDCFYMTIAAFTCKETEVPKLSETWSRCQLIAALHKTSDLVVGTKPKANL